MRPDEEQRETDAVELVVRDEPASVASFRQTVDALAREHGLSDQATFDLKVASGEALANALRHNPAPSSGVDVSLEADAEAIQVEVVGRGRFRLLEGRDPERGRGLPLMVALADEVEFSKTDDGTRVRIRMRVEREEGPAV